MIIRSTLSESDFIRAFLLLWYGNLELTKTEFEVLVVITSEYVKLKDVLPEPYRSKELFSTERLITMRTTLGFSEFSFANYKKQLKEKGALVLVNEVLSLNPKLIPCSNLEFKFTIV